MDDASLAALNTMRAVGGRSKLPLPGVRDPKGRSLAHAAWMLDALAAREVEGNKAQRWLGYAQGLLVHGGQLSLDDAKEANRLASLGRVGP